MQKSEKNIGQRVSVAVQPSGCRSWIRACRGQRIFQARDIRLRFYLYHAVFGNNMDGDCSVSENERAVRAGKFWRRIQGNAQDGEVKRNPGRSIKWRN